MPRAKPASNIEPRAKIWFERDGHVALSDWRVELLEAIDATGSLSAAAELMHVPYRTAWYKLRQAETQLGSRLVETQSGGAAGGGSRLTPAGRDAIERFRRVTQGVNRLVQERFEAEFS
jgi:molybdate transport system regulatory protein